MPPPQRTSFSAALRATEYRGRVRHILDSKVYHIMRQIDSRDYKEQLSRWDRDEITAYDVVNASPKPATRSRW